MRARAGAVTLGLFFLWTATARGADPVLVAAAKKEGTVTFYSGMAIPATEKICQGFQRTYGIKCEYFRAPSVKLFQKFTAEAEAGNIKADVIHGSLPPGFLDAKARGWLAKYTTPEGQKYAARFKDPDGYFVAARFIAMGIAINPQLIKGDEVPRTWKALLDPHWKDKLIASDPGSSGTGLATFYYWEKTFGLDFIRQLAKNRPMIVSSSAIVANSVVSGERPVAAQVDSWEIVSRANKGLAIEGIYPTEGVPAVLSPAAAVAKAPHPSAAQLLLDYMLSAEGQQVFQDEVGSYSARDGMPPLKGAPPLKELHLVDLDWAALQKEAGPAVERYTRALKEAGQ